MQNIQDIKNLIRRRLLIFLLSSIPIFIIVVIIAFTLPPIYVAKSTILVESQQIPQEYVKATVTGYVEERLQTISQGILSRSNLTKIINQFNLYAEMRKKYATEVILDKMRKDINLETIQAGGRRGTSTTVAFTLSYEGKNPSTVQKVANVLASLYLEENLKKREAQATRTTQFLQQELDHIKEQINKYALIISEFKNAHMGALPENNTINVSALEQLKRDIDQADMQIRSLQERKVYLEGQLATISPSTYAGEEGGGEFGAAPEERLNALRLQLINLQSSLSDKHPDVIKLKREIEELQNRASGEKGTSEEEKRLIDMKNKLVAVKSQLGPQHPDVIKLSKEVAGLSKEIKTAKGKTSSSALASQNPVNPAYINLKTQLDSITLETSRLHDEKSRIKKKMNEYQKKIESAPLIEKEYESLNSDYRNAKVKYNEIMSKLMESRVAKGMEETQHGERFTIIEPAATPEAPEKPDRRKIILMGLFLAFGVGAGLAFVQENLDRSIKSEHELDEISHIPILSSIPVIESDEETKRRNKRIITGILIGIGGIIFALVVIHFFIMPLDIVWIKIQRKIMITM
jgi:succinoglycan biosynthesis transport protein ExoP